MRLQIWSMLILACGTAAAVPAAQAQRTLDSLLRRPTDQSPSALIGGKFTRGNIAPLQGTNRHVATIGEQAYQFPRRSYGIGSNMLSSVAVGLQAPLLRQGGGDASAFMSGFTPGARSLGAAIYPGRIRGLPAIDSYLYTPRPETTPFQDYFGLTPDAPPPGRDANKSVPQRMADNLAEQVQRAALEGRGLFREATVEARVLDPATGVSRYPNCRDCSEKLARAVNRLLLVRDLNEKDYVSALLLVHAYLEQERPLAAARQLIYAWERNPELLTATADFDQYFGDATPGGGSAYLTGQMQRYVQIGELNPGASEAFMLEAYCAWRLGDKTRARAAAEQARTLALESADDQTALLGFADTLVAAP